MIINNAINYQCPHCKSSCECVQTDELSDWGGATLYICFNDNCPFFRNSFQTMRMQGAIGGYRFYWSENTGNEGSLLVLTDNSYRDRIIESWFTLDNVEPTPEEKQPVDPVIEYLKRIERRLDQIIMLFRERSK
jgi:hypothetical protein